MSVQENLKQPLLKPKPLLKKMMSTPNIIQKFAKDQNSVKDLVHLCQTTFIRTKIDKTNYQPYANCLLHLNDQLIYVSENQSQVVFNGKPEPKSIIDRDVKIMCLARINTNSCFYAGTSQGYIYKYTYIDKEKFFKPSEFLKTTRNIVHIVISEDMMFCATNEGVILLISISMGEEMFVADHSKKPLTCLVVSSDNKLFSAGKDGHIKVWVTYSLEPLATLEKRNNKEVVSMQVSRKNILFTGSLDCKIGIFSINEMVYLRVFEADSKDIYCLKISIDNLYLFSGHRNGNLQVWDLDSMQKLTSFFAEDEKKAIQDICQSDRDKTIFLGCHSKNLNRINNGSTDCHDNLLNSYDHTISCFVISSCASHLYVATEDMKITQLTIDTKGKQEFDAQGQGHTMTADKKGIRCMMLNYSETSLYSSGYDKIMCVWSVKNFQLTYRFSEAKNPSLALFEGKDERKFYSGDSKGNILVWDQKKTEGELVFTLPDDCQEIRSVIYCNQTDKFIAGGMSGKLIKFNFSTKLKERIKTFTNKKSIYSLQLSENQEFLFIGSDNQNIIVFNLQTEKLLGHLKGHSSPVIRMQCSNDSRFLVSSSLDNSLRLWSIPDFRQVCVFQFDSKVSSICINPIKPAIIYFSQGKSIYILDMGLINDPGVTPSLYTHLFKSFLKSKKREQLKYLKILKEHIFLPQTINMLHVLTFFDNQEAIEHMLEYEVPFLTDQLGNTPLSYCMQTQSYMCIEVFLKQMYLQPENMTFSSADFFSKLKITNANDEESMNRLFLISKPLDDEAVIPSFGAIINEKDQCFFVSRSQFIALEEAKSCLENQEQYVVPCESGRDPHPIQSVVEYEEIVNDSTKKRVEYLVSIFPYKFSHIGSQESIDLLQAFADCENSEIFHSNITLFIDYRWQRLIRYVYILPVTFLCFSIAVIVHVTMIPNGIGLIVLLLIVSILFLLFEFYQVKQEGIKEYVSDIWNWFDMLANVFFIIYCIMRLVVGEHKHQNNNLPTYKMFLAISLSCIMMRLMSQLRAFDSTRNLIRLTIEVVKDMKGFLLVLFMTIIGAGLIFYVVRDQHDTQQIFDSLIDMFLLTFTDFDGPKKSYASGTEWLFLVIFSIFIPIIMLNLLIAIISDTFDRVMAIQQGENYKDKAELLIEIEEIWEYLKGRNEHNSTSDTCLEYLHVCRYVQSSEVITWEGKIRAMNIKINSIHNELQKINEGKHEINHKMNIMQNELLKDFKLGSDQINSKIIAVQKDIKSAHPSGGSAFDGIRSRSGTNTGGSGLKLPQSQDVHLKQVTMMLERVLKEVDHLKVQNQTLSQQIAQIKNPSCQDTVVIDQSAIIAVEPLENSSLIENQQDNNNSGPYRERGRAIQKPKSTFFSQKQQQNEDDNKINFDEVEQKLKALEQNQSDRSKDKFADIKQEEAKQSHEVIENIKKNDDKAVEKKKVEFKDEKIQETEATTELIQHKEEASNQEIIKEHSKIQEHEEADKSSFVMLERMDTTLKARQHDQNQLMEGVVEQQHDQQHNDNMDAVEQEHKLSQDVQDHSQQEKIFKEIDDFKQVENLLTVEINQENDVFSKQSTAQEDQEPEKISPQLDQTKEHTNTIEAAEIEQHTNQEEVKKKDETEDDTFKEES